MRFYPDMTGTAPLVSQLAQDLAKAGEDVTVITSLPHYGRKSIHPDFQHQDGFFHISEHERLDIWRTPVYIPQKPTFFLRALNYMSYTFFSILAGLLVRKHDVVLAINPPITTPFSAWIAALLYSAPLVVGIQDVWPESIILVGQIRNKVLIALSENMEKLQYRIARKVIVLSEGMKNNLIRKRVPEVNIEVIENWADVTKIKPNKGGQKFRYANNIAKGFVVLFAGNHGHVAALETVTRAAEILRSQSDIHFLFVGEGSVKDDLRAFAKRAKLTNVRFMTTQPEEVLPSMLASADIGLVTLREQLGELNIPSKMYNLMAAARPILASVPGDSEIRSLIEKANCGFWVPPEEPTELANGILKAYSRRKELAQLGSNGRHYISKNMTRKRQVAKYRTVLNELAGSK